MSFVGNRYEILNAGDKIEANKVYKARDLYDNKTVSIKVINHNKYICEDFISNLIDECTMLSEINSPFIVKMIDVGMHCTQTNTLYYIASQHTEGILLKNLINGNYLHIEGVIKIFTQIVKALEFGHTNNFYHGSLNSENIIVDSDYNVKICDFGLVKANKGSYLRGGCEIKYMTPHQLCVDYTDKESDFFSLGVILFEMIFKKFPFCIEKTEKGMLKSIDKGVNWTEFKAINGNDELIKIVKKLLDRTNKYSNTQDIILDLSKIMYDKANIEVQQNFDKINSKKEHSCKYGLRKISIAIALVMLLSFIITGCFII